MSHPRGYFALNVVIFMGLFFGGLALGAAVAKHWFQEPARKVAEPIVMAICLLPLVVFVWWSLCAGVPFWKHCVHLIFLGAGFWLIHILVEHIERGRPWTDSLLMLSWVYLCQTVFARWLGTTNGPGGVKPAAP